ncbi:MAG: PEP-CTERM sorting domain-containing protein [Verrucomicrobia bacterium]|nr:PEP-CTERM sorting domain-containing protein [Verrucomicrobiota bacterium]MCH8512427.1 PEP-CTERM sorting domain-containing protein [Kiritimatiellia bacterium]
MIKSKTRTHTTAKLALFAAVLAFSTSAQAATIVTMDTSIGQDWPTSGIAAIQETSNNNRDGRDNRNLTQTFQIPESIFNDTNEVFQLDTIYIEFNNMNNGHNFDLRLFSLPDTRASNLNDAIEINSWSLTTSSTGNQITTFNFSGDPILLDRTDGNGSGYAFQLDDDGTGTTNFQIRWQSAGDVYSGGNAYEEGSRRASNDFTFAVEGTVVIPEPGTLVLLGIAGIAGLIGFRRRKR